MTEFMFAVLMLVVITAPVASVMLASSGSDKCKSNPIYLMMNKAYLDKSKYKILNDLKMLSPNGDIIHIDQLIVSKYGIFVIITDNTKGRIYATENDIKWFQEIYGKRFTFRSPLEKGKRHLKAVKDKILVDNDIFLIVSFTSDALFGTPMPHNVFLGRSYIEYIKSYSKIIYSDKQVKKIVSILSDRATPESKETNIDYLLSELKRV